MIPSPLHPLTVHTVIQYISPPSQLAKPLPSHLISRPLRLRYHFLNPDTPTAYLCWPSPDQDRAIAFLEDLRLDQHNLEPHAVRYVSDFDQILAHVAVTADLRLVFHWDDQDGWKYHDTKLMPFPPECRVSLQSAPILNDLHPINQTSEDDVANDDDGAYWDAYDQRGDEQEFSDFAACQSQEDGQGDSEDAYWAKYASVQGSADSTVPSPRQQKQQQLTTAQVAAQEPGSFPRLRVPSPNAITTALNFISEEDHRGSLSPCSIDFERIPTPEFTLTSPPSDLTSHSSVSAEAVSYDCTDDAVPAPLPSEEDTNLQSANLPPASVCNGIIGTEKCDDALRDGIRAIYQLWKTRQQSRTTELEEKQRFFCIVREAINIQ